jgi:hypothetical protein
MISAEIAVSGYILQPPKLPQIPARVEIPSKRLRDLALLAKTVAEARELLREQSDKFEALFDLVLKRADVNADEIERMAESLMAQQKIYAPKVIAALETLDKHVSAFRESNDSYLNGPVPRSAEEGVDIGRT